MKKFITTTPDPEFNIPSEEKAKRRKGKADPPQAQVVQAPGGGGAPETGEQKPPVDLELLSREEEQQDEPDAPSDDG